MPIPTGGFFELGPVQGAGSDQYRQPIDSLAPIPTRNGALHRPGGLILHAFPGEMVGDPGIDASPIQMEWHIIDKSMHYGFRESSKFRPCVQDREKCVQESLRDAGVPAEMAIQLESGEVALSEFADAINSKRVSMNLSDRITGHSQKNVAGRNGLGEALITRAAAIEKLDLSFLSD